MKRLNLASGILVFILCIFTHSFAQENLTITTYYPSPFGSYMELEAVGGSSWTTFSWPRAIRIGTGAQPAAIQFTNTTGAATRHFGLGASTTNVFYGWYTSTTTNLNDSAHYWLTVNAGAVPTAITLDGNVAITGTLTVPGGVTAATCIDYAPGLTYCPVGYYVASCGTNTCAGADSPLSNPAACPASGHIVCVKY